MVFDQVSWSNTPMFHNTLVFGSSPTSSPRRTPAPTLAPFSGNAHKTDLFGFECMVFDQLSWSNIPMFHNTLVVGSTDVRPAPPRTTRSPFPGFEQLELQLSDLRKR